MNQAHLWSGLQSAALADLRSDWVPGVDPLLVRAARHTDTGRVWLSRKLALHSTLFGYLSMPHVAADEAEQPSTPPPLPDLPDWLFAQADSWHERVMAVGAQVCVSAIRASVQREQVAILRQALGDALYERSLCVAKCVDAEQEQLQPAPVWPRCAESVRRQVYRLGIIEVYHALRCLHPVAAERCALAFPRAWALADMPPVLALASVQRCWAEPLEVPQVATVNHLDSEPT